MRNTYRAILSFVQAAHRAVRRVSANVSFAVVRYLGLGEDQQGVMRSLHIGLTTRKDARRSRAFLCGFGQKVAFRRVVGRNPYRDGRAVAIKSPRGW